MSAQQDGYMADMFDYQEQVERAEILNKVRLRGINTVEDNIQSVHFSYEGVVRKILVLDGQDMNDKIIESIKGEIYE